jgi:PAS domain-containing protein
LIKAKEELEIKVKERTRELSESEEKYRRVVENAHEAIAVTQDERLKLSNSRALDLYGYSAQELPQKTLSDLFTLKIMTWFSRNTVPA